jgi:hypothetical protein
VRMVAVRRKIRGVGRLRGLTETELDQVSQLVRLIDEFNISP